MSNVCPNCGGNLVPRPIRPKQAWRQGTGLGHHPAGTKRRSNGYSKQERQALSARLGDVLPKDR